MPIDMVCICSIVLGKLNAMDKKFLEYSSYPLRTSELRTQFDDMDL
jgi:hypothetical protein